MEQLPTTSGVYLITCTANGRIYVGSSVNIPKRWRDHKSRLNKGTHSNLHLQRAWDKHGQEAFTFTVLERCTRDVLLEREQHFLDTLRPFEEQGFNIAIDAKLPTLGRPVSPETRAKISAANKGHKMPPDVKAKLSAYVGRPKSPEHRAKIGAGNSKQFVVIAPDGTRTRIVNLSKFCQENNLDRTCMSGIANQNGRRKSHKGWKCEYAPD